MSKVKHKLTNKHDISCNMICEVNSCKSTPLPSATVRDLESVSSGAKCVFGIHTPMFSECPWVRGGPQTIAGKRWRSQGRGSVFSAQCERLYVWSGVGGQKAQISSGNRVLSSPQHEGTHSRAAWVVYDQCDVKAVHLQQVHQEGAIALGIQPHGPHVISGESRIDAPRDLRKSLEDAVVEFHEKSKWE